MMRMIVDTDPGVDDIMALLYALHSPRVNVLAITTVHGNVSLSQTTANTFTMLKVLRHHQSHAKSHSSGIPHQVYSRPVVAVGAACPLAMEADEIVDASHVHGGDGMGGTSQRIEQLMSTFSTSSAPSMIADEGNEAMNHEVSERDAVSEWFHQLDTNEPQSVCLVALGPLTNLAHAINRDLDKMRKFKQIVIMGGCISQPTPGGNITPHAEFNFYADPEAAAVVLAAGLDSIVLVPLDVTERCRLRYGVYRDSIVPMALRAPLPSFVADFMGHVFRFMGLMVEVADD
eukprot:Partr_v1_DN25232_c0_g1_i2_m16779 putative Inosineuridine preferring nucleoside hydrolase